MTDLSMALHELSFVTEGDEVIVGRLDTGAYAVLPADGAALLRQISEGMPPAEAAEWYEREYGEAVDMDDFVETLQELGFVRGPGQDDAPPPPRARFQRLGRAVFSPVSWAFYAGAVALYLTFASAHGDLRPSPHQIFFVGSLVVVQTVITFGQIPLLFLHEGFHILAGQRLGLPSKLRMSTRITYIVLETQMNGVLSVARRRRYLPFLAGMVCDFVVLSTLGILAQLTREADGSLSAAGRVCLALGFTVVVRLAWQFQLYLRTDLYYVFATALNCYDLHEASKALLRNRFWRLLGRHDRLADEQQWTEHDRKVAPWYGPFLVSGILALIVTAVYGSIPVVLQYAGILVKNLGAGTFTAQFWDAVFSLAINAAQVTGLVVLSRRTRRQERTAARRPLMTNGAD